MMKKKLFWCGIAVILIFEMCFAAKPEIAAGSYKVSLDENGWKIYKNQLPISIGSFPSLVQGPKWSNVLASNKIWSQAKITKTDNSITVSYESRGTRTTLSAVVTEQNVILGCRFDTTITAFEDAAFWLLALPEQQFSGSKYILNNGTSKHLPVASKDDPRKKTLWQISDASRQITFFTNQGELSVTGNHPFFVFDARFHQSFNEQLRTTWLSTTKLMPNTDYFFTVKMTNSIGPQPRSINDSPVFTIPKTTIKPIIDGKLDEEEWKVANTGALQLLNSNRQPNGSRRPIFPTQVMAMHDNQNLYVAFESSVSPQSTSVASNSNSEIYHDDCVEIFLNPEGGVGFKQILININEKVAVSYTGARPLYELKPGDIKYAMKRARDSWSVEIALPLMKLGINATKSPVFTGNFARENPNCNEYSSLSNLDINFHEENKFLKLHFSNDLAALRRPFSEIEKPVILYRGSNTIEYELLNFSSKEHHITPVMYIGKKNGVVRKYPQKTLIVSPGMPQKTAINFEVDDEDNQYWLELLDEGKKTVYHSSVFQFNQLGVAGELKELRKRLELLQKRNSSFKFNTLVNEIDYLFNLAKQHHNIATWDTLLEKTLDLKHTLERLELLVDQKCINDLSNGMTGYPSSSLEKIFSDLPVREEVKLSRVINLTGAKQEYLNFQFVVLPLLEDLKNLKITINDLTTSDGNKISAENIKFYKVKNVLVAGKLWPDILDSNVSGTVLRRNNQQPFWGTIAIPENAVPGIYSGKILFQSENNATLEVVLRLKVIRFKLPVLNQLIGMIFYYPEEFTMRYPQLKIDSEKKLVNDLIDHGLYPIPAMSHPRSLDTFPVGLDRFYEQKTKRFNFTLIAIFPWVEWLVNYYENGKFKTPEDYYANLCEIVKKNAVKLKQDGYFDSAYVYYDEVNSNQKNVKETLEKVKRDTDVKIITCFCTPALGKNKVKYYEDAIDFFFFNDGYFTDLDLLRYIAELREKGKKIGWYFNMSYPKFPTSNCIDTPGVANRIQFFQQWKYNIDASLFWGANSWWPNDLSGEPIEMKQRGDGLLLYPGDENTPYFPSIRYELLREGIQDYRYLSALKNLIAEKESLCDPEIIKLCNEGKEILKVSWINSIVDYPEDPKIISAEREKLMNCVEKLSNINK